jgi:hypothetical protein
MMNDGWNEGLSAKSMAHSDRDKNVFHGRLTIVDYFNPELETRNTEPFLNYEL